MEISEKEMRAYLAQRGIAHNQKITQLRRVYKSIRKQEEMALNPSLKMAYGHEKMPFKYQERHGSRLAEFYGIYTIDQLRDFVNRSTLKNFTFQVYGVPTRDSPKRREQREIDYEHPIWLPVGPVNRHFVEYAIYNTDTLEGAMTELSGPGQEWLIVYEVVVLNTKSIRP